MSALGKVGIDDYYAKAGAQAASDFIFDSELPWPDPVPLTGALPPVEKFSSDLLTPAFRPMVEDISERMQIPPEIVVAPLVTALAAVVGRRARIQPKRIDSNWQVVPNLWGAIIAPPGFMKSPAMHLALEPVRLIERQWREHYGQILEDHCRAVSECAIRQAAWKELAKSAVKKGASIPPSPEQPRKNRQSLAFL
jgi:Protein of unknown function (DUF3987)